MKQISNSKNSKSFIIIFGLFLLGYITRIIPHPSNFTGFEASILFGGAYFTRRYLAFIIPITVLLLSDFLLNNTIYRSFYPDHNGLILFNKFQLIAILSIVLIVVLGKKLKKSITPLRVLITSILAAFLYWLVSNFFVFLTSPSYPITLAGFVLCFEAAIPFLKNSLLSTILYSTILFGGFELIKSKYFTKSHLA